MNESCFLPVVLFTEGWASSLYLCCLFLSKANALPLCYGFSPSDFWFLRFLKGPAFQCKCLEHLWMDCCSQRSCLDMNPRCKRTRWMEFIGHCLIISDGSIYFRELLSTMLKALLLVTREWLTDARILMKMDDRLLLVPHCNLSRLCVSDNGCCHITSTPPPQEPGTSCPGQGLSRAWGRCQVNCL